MEMSLLVAEWYCGDATLAKNIAAHFRFSEGSDFFSRMLSKHLSKKPCLVQVPEIRHPGNVEEFTFLGSCHAFERDLE